MSKKNKISSDGVGVAMFLLFVGFLISVVQKIWPVLIGVILLWFCFRLNRKKKKSFFAVSDTDEKSFLGLIPDSLNEKKLVDEPLDFMEVPSLNLFGQASHSKNKKYTLVCCDGNGNVGGARKSGLGTYALLEGRRVVKSGHLQRPNDGKVANNGSFVINDWMFSTELNGEVHGFNKDGVELLKYPVKANLFNNGISDDGKFAICQTANAPGDDGNQLFLFDLEAGKLLWKKSPDSGWANRYEFDIENKSIYLEYDRLGKFRYDMQGNFLDVEKWMNARIDKGSGLELAFLVAEKMRNVKKNVTEEELNKLLEVCDLAFKRGFGNRAQEKAMVFKAQGEIFDLKGDLETAKEKYERAFALDPKIGVKRRLGSINKGISKPRPRPSGVAENGIALKVDEARDDKINLAEKSIFQTAVYEREKDLLKQNKHYEVIVKMNPVKLEGKKKVQYLINDRKIFAEEVGKHFYLSCGYEVIWTENDYWSQLLALCFWDVVFSRVKGSVSVGDGLGNITALNVDDRNFDKLFEMFVMMNGMPADLFSVDFYERRKKLIQERFFELDNLDLVNEVRTSYELNLHKKCRLIYDWGKFSLDQLLVAPKLMKKETFLGLLKRILINVNENRSGLPDLFAYKNREVLFSEVKSENDRLSKGQMDWHSFLETELNLRVEMFHIKRLGQNDLEV